VIKTRSNVLTQRTTYKTQPHNIDFLQHNDTDTEFYYTLVAIS